MSYNQEACRAAVLTSLLVVASCDTPAERSASEFQADTSVASSPPVRAVQPAVPSAGGVLDRVYRAPEGAYTLSEDPGAHGFTQRVHEKINDSDYVDRYVRENDLLMIGAARNSASLDTAYTQSSTQSSMLFGRLLEQTLAPGEGIRLVGEGPPRTVTVDGRPGLRGGLEYWKYRGDVATNPTYTNKFVLHVTVVDGLGPKHVIAVFYTRTTTEHDSGVERLYESILDGFRPVR